MGMYPSWKFAITNNRKALSSQPLLISEHGIHADDLHAAVVADWTGIEADGKSASETGSVRRADLRPGSPPAGHTSCGNSPSHSVGHPLFISRSLAPDLACCILACASTKEIMSFESAVNRKAIDIGKLSIEMTTAAGSGASFDGSVTGFTSSPC